MSTANEMPSFTDFVTRRFASRSPFWSWMIFERIGGALAYCFARLGGSPAAATLLGGASGVAGAVLLGVARTPGQVVGAAALLLLAYSLDCSDGQLARATGRASAHGAWLDVAVDSVVTAFVTAALTVALLDSDGPVVSVLLAGAYGASRAASLLTATIVRREHGGMHFSGLVNHLRTAFVSVIDTPVVYVLLCATRLTPSYFRIVILILTLMTAVQILVSARHHFSSRLQRH